MRLTVTGIGIVGPGLADWTGARPVLAGDQPYVADTLRISPPLGRLAAEIAAHRGTTAVASSSILPGESSRSLTKIMLIAG